MTKPILAALFLAALVACSKAPETVQQNSASPANDRSQTAISRSTDNSSAASIKTGEKTKWTQSGDPIDTKKFDAAIAVAEIAFKKSPNDTAVKKALAESYYERAVALTDARQYAAALGDYRRAFKYNPENADAKKWIDLIISIYDGKNQEYPKEGEEPPPLPITKGN